MPKGLLALAALNPSVIQERLGNATVKATLDTCLYLIPGQQRDLTEQLGADLHDEFETAVEAGLTRPTEDESEKSARVGVSRE